MKIFDFSRFFSIFQIFSRFFRIFRVLEQDPPKKCSISELRWSWKSCRSSNLPAIYPSTTLEPRKRTWMASGDVQSKSSVFFLLISIFIYPAREKLCILFLDVDQHLFEIDVVPPSVVINVSLNNVCNTITGIPQPLKV